MNIVHKNGNQMRPLPLPKAGKAFMPKLFLSLAIRVLSTGTSG